MDPILFESTNGTAEKVRFREALLAGQAPDRGLYIPVRIPSIESDEISSLKGKSYPEIAYEVTNKFLYSELPESELKRIVEESYNFDVPLEKVFGRTHIMRLDRGPTAAFKDFAARMMARLMRYFLEEEGRSALILTATSGDTGSAVANAFNNVENVEVVVLFPRDEVTGRQRRQMTTLGGNVSAVAVDGKFDDCQRLVKEAFADPDLSGLNLSSANSINFGRLLPQIVYYYYAYSRLSELEGERIVFSVPSGNFGNMMGCVLAHRMGLPIEKIVAPTNENDEFPRFLTGGAYSPISPSRACISNAMNVGHPSNLARLFHVYGGWIDEKGGVHKMPDIEAMRGDLFSVSVSDAQTRETIKSAYEEYKVVLEPHGAVGWRGLMEYLRVSGWEGLSVSLETADPAKFPEEIVKVLGFEPELPESMKGLDKLEEKYEELPGDYSSLKKYLLGR